MTGSPFKLKRSPHILGAVPIEPPAPVAAHLPELQQFETPAAGVVIKAIPRPVLEAHLPDWKVVDGQKKALLPTTQNFAALMALGGWRARYNEMTKRIELVKDGLLAPQDDAENTALTLLGDWAVMHGLPRECVAELSDAIGRGDPYHPVRDWVLTLKWDGVDRREMLLNTLELEDPSTEPLAARLLYKWMLQGVGALMEPNGLMAAGMLVVVGPQYAGKTYWSRALVPITGAFRDGLTIDPNNKDSLLKAVGTFLGELGELDATMRKADIAQLKAFLTSNEDEVRLPYARRAARFKRRTLFVGTVNGSGFLVDETGNRRFWVIAVTKCHVLPPELMQQVWAQYMHLYQKGERWNLEPNLLEALNASNRRFETVDPLAERITSAFDWASVDLGTVTDDNRTHHPELAWMTATQICMSAGVQDPRKSDATRAAGIVKSRWDVQGHLSAQLGKVALLDRRSNGIRLIAVPKKRGFSA